MEVYAVHRNNQDLAHLRPCLWASELDESAEAVIHERRPLMSRDLPTQVDPEKFDIACCRWKELVVALTGP